eukprot:756732-Hanusia_phi.AAC.3
MLDSSIMAAVVSALARLLDMESLTLSGVWFSCSVAFCPPDAVCSVGLGGCASMAWRSSNRFVPLMGIDCDRLKLRLPMLPLESEQSSEPRERLPLSSAGVE